jgi:hypothetical protein
MQLHLRTIYLCSNPTVNRPRIYSKNVALVTMPMLRIILIKRFRVNKRNVSSFIERINERKEGKIVIFPDL